MRNVEGGDMGWVVHSKQWWGWVVLSLSLLTSWSSRKKTDLRGNWFAETNHICPESMVTNVRDPGVLAELSCQRVEERRDQGQEKAFPKEAPVICREEGEGNKEPTILQIR